MNPNNLYFSLNGWYVRMDIYDGAGGIWVEVGQLFVLNDEWMQLGDLVIPKTSIAQIERLSSPARPDTDDSN